MKLNCAYLVHLLTVNFLNIDLVIVRTSHSSLWNSSKHGQLSMAVVAQIDPPVSWSFDIATTAEWAFCEHLPLRRLRGLRGSALILHY